MESPTKSDVPRLFLKHKKMISFPSQPQKVFNALTCTKTHILFTEEKGVEEHCQCTAPMLSNQRIFDWLDEIMQNLEGESSHKPNIVDTQLQKETS